MMSREKTAQKLTLKFLRSLHEGDFLVSTVTDDKGCSVYEGDVPSAHLREFQWEKIKQVEADQRGCMVFDSKAQFVRFFEQIQGIPINKWK